MTTVGVITRGKYGNRLIETIGSKTDMQVVHASVPDIIPDMIDEPHTFLKELDIDKSVFNADIIITYSLHPDLTVAIAHMAGKAGAKALIVPGGTSKAPLTELRSIQDQYGMLIEVEEICCALNEKPQTRDFCAQLSIPVLEICIKEDIIESVNVLRGAPCGSTWHMARGLVGTRVEEAPSKGGLLIQQYPCRAIRGNMGGIHRSAEIHKRAVEEALEKKK